MPLADSSMRKDLFNVLPIAQSGNYCSNTPNKKAGNLNTIPLTFLCVFILLDVDNVLKAMMSASKRQFSNLNSTDKTFICHVCQKKIDNFDTINDLAPMDVCEPEIELEDMMQDKPQQKPLISLGQINEEEIKSAEIAEAVGVLQFQRERQCAFCDKTTCRSCLGACRVCEKLACTICSKTDFSCYEERICHDCDEALQEK